MSDSPYPPYGLESGIHAARPDVGLSKGKEYYCTTHSLVYESDGASWSTRYTVPSGGVQAVSLLGPFHVEHDDAGLATTGIPLVSLTSSQVVIRVMAVVTEAAPVGDTVLFIGLGGSTWENGDWSTISSVYWDSVGTSDPVARRFAGVIVGPEDAPRYGEGGLLTDDGVLLAFIGAAPTAGEMDIYVLIAEPSE